MLGGTVRTLGSSSAETSVSAVCVRGFPVNEITEQSVWVGTERLLGYKSNLLIHPLNTQLQSLKDCKSVHICMDFSLYIAIVNLN